MKALLFTDSFGIAQLAKYILKTNITGIVGASIRMPSRLLCNDAMWRKGLLSDA
jgi:hypothetical protein